MRLKLARSLDDILWVLEWIEACDVGECIGRIAVAIYVDIGETIGRQGVAIGTTCQIINTRTALEQIIARQDLRGIKIIGFKVTSRHIIDTDTVAADDIVTFLTEDHVIAITANQHVVTAAEGTKLLEIIPDETPIVFYVEVPVASITDVNIGQPAKVTLSTMDTRRNPPLEARVMSIDPDATEEENGNRYYSAILKIEDKPEDVNLVPGVTGAASILLGKRTVLLYFLEPIWDAMQGALSEG